MQISKIALAVGVSAGLLMGCNSDGLPVANNPDNPDASGSDLTLTTGTWQIGEDTGIGLPNVYVFNSDGSHKYYDDDETPYEGYKIKDASVDVARTLRSAADTVSFKLFDATGLEVNATEIRDADFDINDEGDLTISSDDLLEPLTGANQESDDVADAVIDANEEAGVNGYVQILDTNHAGTKTDVGELRLKLSDSSTGASVDSIESGKVSVKLIYQVDEDSTQEVNDNGNNAYISLFASGTSNINLHGEVIFNNGEIFYRSAALVDGKPPVSDQPVGTYNLGDDLDVEVEWANGYYTFTVNGEVYNNSGNGFEAVDKSAVTVIALKLGDTSNVTHYELLADDLKVYSNDNEPEELVFEDNFDSYSNNQDLSGNPYNNNSAEAVVILDGGEADPVDPVDNQVAAITDNDEGDTGELRYKFDEGMTTGTHKVRMFYSVDETESAYVSLFDSANSTKSLIGELKLDEGKVTLRGEDSWGTTFTPGEWVDLEMLWDTSSNSEVGTYTVKVNGTEYGPFDSFNTTPGVEVTATAIKFSSNSGTAETTLYIDDYKVYSDTVGETEVFVDDYEGYSIGADLTSSPYNSSSFSAVVSADPSNAE